jgi:hypothetical protein
MVSVHGKYEASMTKITTGHGGGRRYWSTDLINHKDKEQSSKMGNSF